MYVADRKDKKKVGDALINAIKSHYSSKLPQVMAAFYHPRVDGVGIYSSVSNLEIDEQYIINRVKSLHPEVTGIAVINYVQIKACRVFIRGREYFEIEKTGDRIKLIPSNRRVN